MSNVFRFHITIREEQLDSTYRIQYDAPAIQWMAVDGFIPFVSAGLTVAGMIYIIAPPRLAVGGGRNRSFTCFVPWRENV